MASSAGIILDIRRAKFEDSIPAQVTAGLLQQPKTLPALLFYSTEGIRHWNRHSQAADFYPRREEIQILRHHAADMAAVMVHRSVIVDLGSASSDKVVLLLDALEAARKPVTYYALDLSYPELQTTLSMLATRRYQFVQCAALHGTFEDGLHWLKNTPGINRQPHYVLLFGLTIGNFSRSNAAQFLSSVTAHALAESPAHSAILLTLDGCQEPTKVLRAYRAKGVDQFALAALDYANELLSDGEDGTPPFRTTDWQYHSEWNAAQGRHEASLVPREGKHIDLGTSLDRIRVCGQEKVRFGCSYKYGDVQRQQLWAQSGLHEAKTWSDEACDVAFYLLQQR
ncbi:hypothetical protein AbraIFM66951_005471 [Aspergillus brasiliensis]|uniref:4-dimethylallyltryptophan N-methyltransferase n=1 Tax=Aspergillus brasiliensis TaxID=319629 RepID=A0A9W6DUH1_9EURO|nr:hypothetical protein AbraCBS73388_004862 [Aspergillus brasiliensis]GKZ51324.1 hypothetical protein AbraIFM66951_005471 [Aspergillus brasiliensis]